VYLLSVKQCYHWRLLTIVVTQNITISALHPKNKGALSSDTTRVHNKDHHNINTYTCQYHLDIKLQFIQHSRSEVHTLDETLWIISKASLPHQLHRNCKSNPATFTHFPNPTHLRYGGYDRLTMKRDTRTKTRPEFRLKTVTKIARQFVPSGKLQR
jgi:hypothetical protein